ncbi:hypothetical protein CK203_085938 [Vitis vinifera]|uniref:Uncharacterized protein n=1 Tax=Vitis vinifera TaxID=29760 RepID=A0A438DVF4_VITVI|nr:hypothetical protein CK203_085938 [Vitis vinifera]
MAYYDDDVASTASTTSTMVVSTRMRLKDFEPFSFYQTSQVLPALWHSQDQITQAMMGHAKELGGGGPLLP